jgi:hypothetical protein
MPISLRFSETNIKELIEYYIKNNYYLYWFDLGKALNEATIGKIRYINRLFNEHKLFKNCIYYFTNIKRRSSPTLRKIKVHPLIYLLL